MKADLLTLAEEMEATHPDWAARVRAATNVGRPTDDLLRDHQKYVRDWMIAQFKKKRRREEVLSEVVQEHGETPSYWWNLYRLKGRPSDYFA